MMSRAGATRILPSRSAIRLRGRCLAGARRWLGTFGLLGCLCWLFLPSLAASQGSAKIDPAKVEAAFLRNFAHYISWPDHAFANERSPWRICVLGSDPYGETLEETFNGRMEQGRTFEVVRAESPGQVATCQIVFVGLRGSASRHAALAELSSLPILTVSDAPDFLDEGGMIRFQVSNHVEFSVNLDRTRAASLKVQTKMLEVAHEVLENGIVRSRR